MTTTWRQPRIIPVEDQFPVDFDAAVPMPSAGPAPSRRGDGPAWYLDREARPVAASGRRIPEGVTHQCREGDADWQTIDAGTVPAMKPTHPKGAD